MRARKVLLVPVQARLIHVVKEAEERDERHLLIYLSLHRAVFNSLQHVRTQKNAKQKKYIHQNENAGLNAPFRFFSTKGDITIVRRA